MINDIEILKVEEMAIAMIPKDNDPNSEDEFWEAWLINLRDAPLHSVIINSSGSGLIEDEPRKTSSLRYFWERIGGETAVMIEPVHEEALALANQYWVSFLYKDYLYDKRYVFVPGALREEHFTEIPIIGKRGVMIR